MAVKMLDPRCYCSFVFPADSVNIKYQKAIVSFKLKSDYPLYSEKTLVDHVVSGGRIIVFASEHDDLKKQKYSSSHLFLLEQKKKGLSFYVSDTWAVAVKKDRNDCLFFEFYDDMDFKDELHVFFEHEKGLSVNLFYEKNASTSLRKILSEYFDVHETLVTDRKINFSYRKCRIFGRKRISSNRVFFLLLVFFLSFILSLFLPDLISEMDKKTSGKDDRISSKHDDLIKTPAEKNKKNYTPFCIISVLSKSGDLKNVRSFHMEKNDFKIDVVDFNDDQAVSALKKEMYVSSVSVDGVDWNEKGSKKTRLSGKLDLDFFPGFNHQESSASFVRLIKNSGLSLKKMSAFKSHRNESSWDFIMEGKTGSFIKFSQLIKNDDDRFYFSSFSFSSDGIKVLLSCRVHQISPDILYEDYSINNSTLGLVSLKKDNSKKNILTVEAECHDEVSEKKDIERYFFIGSSESQAEETAFYYFKDSSGKIHSLEESQILLKESSGITAVINGKKIIIER